MYREKRRNKIIILILIGILCLMGVGYAAFKTSINITGTTDISSSWDIKIISADVTDTNGTGENVKNAYNDLSASLEANLYEKEDYVEYSIIVENKGTFDAKLETIGITNSNNEAVKITSSGLTKGQTLYKNSTATLKVKIEYNSSYEGDASGTSGEAKIDLDFVQNSGGTIEPEKNHLVTYDYSTNGGSSTTAENEYINEGESINLSYTATKEGYDFIGWNTNKAAQEGLKELTMGTSDVTLYAIFKSPDDTPPVIENVSTSSTTNSITVVVTASDEESGISKYEFKINDNEWIDNGTNNVYIFTGLTQNTGYEISVRVTNGIGLTAEGELSASLNLTDNVVSSGDGLYKDKYEENIYTYRGANPNNYVNFNNELWRIISIDGDNNTIKILKNNSLGNMSYDLNFSSSESEKDTIIRFSDVSTDYCYASDVNSYYGCNIWGSNNTLYNRNMESVKAIDIYYDGYSDDVYQLPKSDAYLNTYLNTTFYNQLSATARRMIVENVYQAGVVSHLSSNTLMQEVNYANSVKWKGSVALINVNEYLKASTDNGCINIYSSRQSPYPCSKNNWLYLNGVTYWTMSPASTPVSNHVWYINGSGQVYAYYASNSYQVYPVVTLSSAVKITGGEGNISNPFELMEGIGTLKLDKPTFSESGDKAKTVTITYPEGTGLTYEYQKDDGSWTTATQSQQVEFTESGILVARVTDGTNTETATYSVEIASAGSDLVDMAGVVNTGDGLYKDSQEENVYTYRGANPNNYVSFNNELWRIVSANTSDNAIKIMRISSLENMEYDGPGYRATSEYCNESKTFGCNIWGSKSTLYDFSGINKITELAHQVGGSKYALPEEEAELNTYLNVTYYNGLNAEAKSMIKKDAIYKVGVLYYTSSQTASTDMTQVSAAKWKGKIGLVDATEYVRASNNTSCSSVYAYMSISGSSCYSNSSSHNWMYTSSISYWWTMTPLSNVSSRLIWTVNSGGNLGSNAAFNERGVRPVVTLKSDIKITGGNGSQNNPYTLTL